MTVTMEITMYDKLLLLPLFQGLSREDLTTILGKVKFHFQKYPTGSKLIGQGDKCDALFFILDGKVASERRNEEMRYAVYETSESPQLVEPYSLFGMYPTYTASYYAMGSTSALSIRKSDILSVLSKYNIFLINYLNLLSNHAQCLTRKQWSIHPGDTGENIVNFLRSQCLTMKGEKQLNIRMEDFATLTGETRINISKELNDLQGKGLLSLSRKIITIPDMERLTNALSL